MLIVFWDADPQASSSAGFPAPPECDGCCRPCHRLCTRLCYGFDEHCGGPFRRLSPQLAHELLEVRDSLLVISAPRSLAHGRHSAKGIRMGKSMPVEAV